MLAGGARWSRCVGSSPHAPVVVVAGIGRDAAREGPLRERQEAPQLVAELAGWDPVGRDGFVPRLAALRPDYGANCSSLRVSLRHGSNW